MQTDNKINKRLAIIVNSYAFLSPLKFNIFRAIWLATLITNIGIAMQNAGAAWVMVNIEASPLMVALIQTAATLPIFLFAMPFSVYADQMHRAKFLLYVQIFMAMIALLLAAITLLGFINTWVLLIFTFLLSTGIAIRMPAWQAAASELVPPAEIAAAASINNLSFNIGRCIGPAIAGILMAKQGPAYVFLLNGVALMSSLYFFAKWYKNKASEMIGSEKFWHALKHGLLTAMESVVFRIILLRAFILFFGSSALWCLLPLLAKYQLHATASGFGILMGCLGVGAILAAPLLPHLRTFLSATQLIRLSILLFASMQWVMFYLNNFYVACLILLIAGSAWAIFLSTMNASAQSIFPPAIRARAIAIYLMAFYGGLTLGSIIWGKLAEQWCTSAALVIASMILTISSFLLIKHKHQTNM